MKIVVKNKEVELKYSYNSFKYLEELDVEELQGLQNKPFKLIGMVNMLLMGAINHNPKVVYSELDVNEYLEQLIIDGGNFVELLNKLMEELQNSPFFKAIQGK